MAEKEATALMAKKEDIKAKEEGDANEGHSKDCYVADIVSQIITVMNLEQGPYYSRPFNHPPQHERNQEETNPYKRIPISTGFPSSHPKLKDNNKG